jgi:hypothetical protein
MGNYLEGVSEFSFRTEVNYDRALDGGQKFLYGRRAEISMRRPNRLHVLRRVACIRECAKPPQYSGRGASFRRTPGSVRLDTIR